MKHYLRNAVLTILVALLLFSSGLVAADRDFFDPNDSDYAKWAPVLVDDALMPNAGEIELIHRWIDHAFTSTGERSNRKDRREDSTGLLDFTITLLRQDYSTLKSGESCMGTPLKIGKKEFKSGLGTHANSEILVEFAEPIVGLSAQVGIDNNFSTHGSRGSVTFSVLANEKEAVKTPVRTGKDDSYPIELTFDSPTAALTLIVATTEDGAECDQADWCDLVVQTASGKTINIGDTTILPLQNELPFSFKYNGRSSRDFLKDWTAKVAPVDSLTTGYSWTDPETAMTVTATVRRFGKFPAIDWVLTFKNEGQSDSPLIEDVKVIDEQFSFGLEHEPIAIHTLTGDYCNDRSWLPTVYPVAARETKIFQPQGGRPSNDVFPFWNVVRSQVADHRETEGFFVAIGWSGQWELSIEKTTDYKTAVRGGMENLSTILHPGEEIRTPRILLMPWKSDRLSAQVLFRRLLMFEYAPKMAGGIPQEMLRIGQCFDRYYRKRPGWEKYPAQVEFAKRLKEADCNAYWFDAAWFPRGFPDGTGSWVSDLENFPQGLEALGDAIKSLNMKFVLWFEPERVSRDTIIANEYPQYVFGGKEGGLYKLNDPEARQFLTDLLVQRMREFKVDIYRNDFNVDPLSFWLNNDAPNRRGITEIRYVEGHYQMWNDFRREIPGLWIDNCASGGRRIDLETTSISVPLWRSDTCCWSGHPEWDQNQALGLTQYLPLFSCAVWDPSPYTFRSGANMGCILQYNFLDDDYDPQLTKASVDEAKAYQKFWYGDFYPLSQTSTNKEAIIAWQLHRSDLEAGLIYVFRQENSPYIGRSFDLRAIDPEATYIVRIKPGYEVAETFEMKGKELIAYPLMIKEKKSAVVIEYEKKEKFLCNAQGVIY